jgi:TolA-binding protein
MSLNQLKKQLKQQNRDLQRAKSNKPRWIWFCLGLMIMAIVAWPMYQRHQQTLPQQLLNQGERLESLGQIEAAQNLYLQLHRDYPQALVAAEALLRSGRIWQYDRHQDQQALLSYLQLEHDYPDSPLVQIGREEAARIIKYSLRDYSRAIVSYQRLLDSAVSKQDQYLYEIADCYFRLDNYIQARIELETLEQQYPQSDLIPELLYRKGGLLLLEKRLTDARNDWQRLIDEFPDSPYRAQARFNLASLLEEDNLLPEALEQYQQMTDFPQPLILEEKIEHLKQRILNKQKAPR